MAAVTFNPGDFVIPVPLGGYEGLPAGLKAGHAYTVTHVITNGALRVAGGAGWHGRAWFRHPEPGEVVGGSYEAGSGGPVPIPLGNPAYTPGPRHARAEYPVPAPPIREGDLKTTKAPLEVQVGGAHYKDMAIQPIEYVLANAIPFAEGNIIKYVSRWRKKGGVEDLKKARHMLDVLITHEEKRQTNG